MAESLLRRPAGKAIWAWILCGTCVLVVAATLLIVLMPGARRMAVFVLLTLWCHGPLSPLLPAAYEPVLLAYGQLFPPLLIAIIGASSSTLVEWVNYHLYRRLLKHEAFERALRGSSTRRVITLFGRHPFLAVWVCVVSPLPDWAARVLASHSGYSVRRYLTAFLLARLPRFWVLSALGLHLRLGFGTVLWIAAGSIVVTAILRSRPAPTTRPPASFPSEATMRTSLLLLLGITQLGTMLPCGKLLAQQPSTGVLEGVARGASLDLFIYEGVGLTAASFRLSHLTPGALGTEVGVSLFPGALPAGAIILAPDLGASYNISLPRATLLIKGGGSAIGGVGSGGAAFVPGFHLGGALVVRIGGITGTRIDLIRHFYVSGGESQPLWSIGVGLTALPRWAP